MSETVTLFLPIHFPAGRVDCQNCPLMEEDPRCRSRKVCKVWPQTINDVTERGWMCPLIEAEETEDGNDGQPETI